MLKKKKVKTKTALGYGPLFLEQLLLILKHEIETESVQALPS